MKPMFPRDHLHQVPLDLHRIGLVRQTEKSSEAFHVRIDGDSLCDSIRVSQHDIGCLACDARDLEHLRHRAGQGSVKPMFHDERGLLDALRLGAIEAGRKDQALKLATIDGNVFIERTAPAEERGSDLIHLLVGALRRKHNRDQKLEGRLIMQDHSGARK